MRLIKAFLSLLLTLIIAVGAPVQTIAASQPVYISDVMVGMGETAGEAMRALTDAGFTVLEHNLNEGAGSKMKTEKFVFIGYKTTTDPDEAICDLAVMNMNGGYSFSDYEALMDKYRDSQIKPFIDNFIATIEEYRANYNSDNEENKAKADFAYAILNKILEDDTGELMGDLLLNPTKEELGLTDEQYKALPDAEKKKTVDLTTSLMQGNSQIILLIEQTLAMAADTNDMTWLERLSELGPDGLDEKYAEAGVRPSDAEREMASLYSDTARVILENWVDFRSDLIIYEMIRNEEIEELEGVEEIVFDEDALAGVYGEAEQEEYDVETPLGAMQCVNDRLEASLDVADSVEDSRVAAVYDALKETPYGDGTMFDLFTKPYDEVSGENISALYPLVSVLTEGQVAAIEFLPLDTLIRIGVMNGEAFRSIDSENSDIMTLFDNINAVSIYYNVNREIFSNYTALTSETLRKNAGGFDFTQPMTELGGLSSFTALFWAADAVTLAGTIYNTARYIPNADLADRLAKLTANMAKQFKTFSEPGRTIIVGVDPQAYGKLTFGYGEIGVGGKITLDSRLVSYDIYDDYGLTNEAGSYEEIKALLDGKAESAMKKTVKFRNYAQFFGATFAVITAFSIVMTIYDLYRYYNVDYTPIPKYIVDEADITTLDADGSRIVVRNDAAYYTVALTNRPETADHYKCLEDFSDLNGDAGKEWLALYYNKDVNREPILADSLKVVTGTASIPEGYTKGIHMFGSTAAANITDSRYTYNDNLNGIYVYYMTEETSPADAASVFSAGNLAVIGVSGLALGAVLGVITTSVIKRKKSAAAA